MPAPRRSPASICWSIWACRVENIMVTDIAGVVYRGPQGADGPAQGALRPGDERAHAGRSHCRRRRVPRPVRAGCAEAGDGRDRWRKGRSSLRSRIPMPEIMPEEVRAVRPDAIIATGRSDYPNQVNNVLCFPFIFRGALDVGATTINEAMKIAAVRALAELAQAEPNDIVAAAYGGQNFGFGPEYLIPRPFDPG